MTGEHISTGLNNSKQVCRWHAYSSLEDLEKDATLSISKLAQNAIKQSGHFSIVLAGGTTPTRVYEALKNISTDWSKWHIYFGDERCLAADNPDRNSLMASRAWLSHVGIPKFQIHDIPAESGAESAATAYSNTIGKIDQFDLVILGLGEDGHTASLFPGHDYGSNLSAADVLPVHNAPKPPSDRVSLSAHRLSNAQNVLFLVTGTSKIQAVQDWRSGKNIPASSITPDNGVDIYIEENLLGSRASQI